MAELMSLDTCYRFSQTSQQPQEGTLHYHDPHCVDEGTDTERLRGMPQSHSSNFAEPRFEPRSTWAPDCSFESQF